MACVTEACVTETGLYRRSGRFALRRIGNEAVLVDRKPCADGYPWAYSLDGPAAVALWEELDGETALPAIALRLAARFGEDPERVRADLEVTLRDWMRAPVPFVEGPALPEGPAYTPPTLPVEAFGLRFQKPIFLDRLPIQGMMELTHRCTIACVHCYTLDSRAYGPELTTEEVFSAMDQFREAGTLFLCLSGGEAMMRRDFREIYEYGWKSGFLMIVFSNGTVVTEEMADFLAAHTPYNVEVSMYGATEETYQKVVGVPGSHARFCKGVDRLLRRGVPVDLKSVALTINRHELPAMREFCHARGLHFKYDADITPHLDGGRFPLAYRLSPEEVLALDLEDPGRTTEFREAFARPRGPVNHDKLLRCGAGTASFVVDPYGRLTLCTILRRQSYDLRKGSFADGWGRFFPGIMDTRRDPSNRCTACSKSSVCTMCPGQAQLEWDGKDPESPVEFLCEVTQLREKTFGAAGGSPACGSGAPKGGGGGAAGGGPADGGAGGSGGGKPPGGDAGAAPSAEEPGEEGGKRPYAPPRISALNLSPSESLVTSCKSYSAALSGATSRWGASVSCSAFGNCSSISAS